MVVNDIIEQAAGRQSKESERGNYLKEDVSSLDSYNKCEMFLM